MFNIKEGTLIKKKNVLQAFYFLLSKWHENIRTIHCDVFCCHLNCHSGKYFLRGEMYTEDIDDSVIVKTIHVNYHFYGWRDNGEINSAVQTSNPAAVFTRGIKS